MEIYNICKEQQYDHGYHYESNFRHFQSKEENRSSSTSYFYDDEVLDLSKRDTDEDESSKLIQQTSQYDLQLSLSPQRINSPNSSTQCNSSIINSNLKSKQLKLSPIKRESSSPLSNASTISQSYLSDNYQSNLINSVDILKSNSLVLEQLSKNHLKNNFYNYKNSIDLKSSVIDSSFDNLPLPTSASIPLINPKILNVTDGKTRPFKAYPQDPLVIAANFAAADVLYDGRRVEGYTEYRKRILEQIRSTNGGQRTLTNPKMRRTNSRNSNHRSNNNKEESLNIDNGKQFLNHNSNSNSESEDRFTESSDNDASSSTPSTTHNVNNNNNPTIPNQNQNGVIKDAAYYERRRKNNAAAKKSRDRRRIKEDEIAIRAAYLERQNIELLCQLDALKAQLASLQKNLVS